MAIADAAALVVMGLGAMFLLTASIGLVRFPDVLTRMHAASKPQTVGLVLMLLGIALALRSFAEASMLLLVLLAQMATVPLGSTMLARAAFRRGFVRGADYVVDELSPRLAHTLDQDDDEDGFIDEDQLAPELGDFSDAEDRFPTNTVGAVHAAADRSQLANWDEDEPEPLIEPEEIDIDDADLVPPEAPAPTHDDRRHARRRLR